MEAIDKIIEENNKMNRFKATGSFINKEDVTFEEEAKNIECFKNYIEEAYPTFIISTISLIESVENKQYAIQKIIWRLSSLILIPILITVFIIYMPVKWIITGVYGFSTGDKRVTYEHWVYLWIQKTGI